MKRFYVVQKIDVKKDMTFFYISSEAEKSKIGAYKNYGFIDTADGLYTKNLGNFNSVKDAKKKILSIDKTSKFYRSDNKKIVRTTMS